MGYAVLHEVPVNGRYADLLAGRDEQLVAVELKLADWKEALAQAMHYQLAAQRSYVALPLAKTHAPLRARSRFERQGVGVLGVAPAGDVRLLLDARENERRLPFLTHGVLDGWFRGRPLPRPGLSK